MKTLKKLYILKQSIVVVTMLVLLASCKTETKNSGNAAVTTTVATSGLRSEMTKPDKKKYYNNADDVVYEVKYKPDSFKLRTASSELIWKVKLYDAKIKISDNEENLNPFEIKKLENGEAKLEKNEETIARGLAASASDLVFQISTMPKEQQEILVAELKAKGF